MQPGFKKFKNVCIQHFNNCSITVEDADAARDILGLYLCSLKDKTARRENQQIEAGIDPVL